MSEKYFHELGDATLYTGDCLDVLETLPDQSVQTCITSPPYFGLRDYGVEGQMGLEPTPDEFVAALVAVFREVRRVLRDDGTLWLNLGDSYNSAPVGRFNGGGFKDTSAATGTRDMSGVKTSGKMNKLAASGLPPKNLLGIPWRVAFALQADGWYLRQDIIWSKPNPMPESVKDRCTKAHEYIFLLSKSARYYFDNEAIKEPLADASVKRGAVKLGGNKGVNYTPDPADPNFRNGKEQWGRELDFSQGGKRNKRSVWTVAPRPYKEAHFATFPPDLIEPCVLAGAPAGGVVLDPFSGSGTTGQVALENHRKYIGIELNSEYQKLAIRRIKG